MSLGIDEQGTTSVASRFGAFLTLILLTLLGAYSSYQIMRVVGSRRYSLLEYSIKDSLKSEDTFTATEGFMISFALDNEYGPDEVPREVGNLTVAAWVWGYDENDVYYSDIIPIESHNCTEYELGLNEVGEGV